MLLQSSPLLRRRFLDLTISINGIDLFLELLSSFRKRDPEKDSLEEEYAENVFDCLTCVVDEGEGKRVFVEAEGVELCLIMLKEGSFSKVRALRVLDHAVGGQGSEAAEVCARVVDAAGIKPIFSLFMKKTADNATIEHLLGIFSALLRLLPGESEQRIRVIAKFLEKYLEKITRLTQLRRDFARRLAAVDKEIRLESQDLDEEDLVERADEFFSRRLDGGLFSLRTVDVVLAWLAAEDRSVRKHIGDEGIAAIRGSLQEQMDGLDPDGEDDGDTREMLGALIESIDV